MAQLTTGQVTEIKFKGLAPGTTYDVKLNWSLLAPRFPDGWSVRTTESADLET
eukprot:CAMPEP_0113832386 /NCGR_PEP_ID=MMETSP0328-20130328/7353_1 /TAXON_ID=39455 /ORGANISM="Alexandrium minutum" /LENGTH=52 /DNA_ID=CAMNT_0000800599 /DNA_START=63 /DNA_END=218 /DNA_ORIENTATION=+ /assembly_acc=CAM_ASM_000350